MDEKKEFDCRNASVEEKELLFGKAFALLDVVSFSLSDGVMFTTVKIDGNEIVLIGHPETALHNFLLGRSANVEHWS